VMRSTTIVDEERKLRAVRQTSTSWPIELEAEPRLSTRTGRTGDDPMRRFALDFCTT